MKSKVMFVLLVMGLPATALLMAGLSEGEEERESAVTAATPTSAPVSATAGKYQAECGSCHMAYPPRLLPAATWRALMNRLDNHFGDNAELAPAVRNELTRYLVAHARPRARDFATRYDGSDAGPLRISERRWFRREHREISDRMVSGNDQVRSFSNCAACHTDAARGRFSEHGVRIPGYGRWDD
jgi:hypothetical protein